MGKYLRKAKISGDVVVMDVSQSYLGVRTRAKTLALQRLQSSSAAADPSSPFKADYLELRSRCLEKRPLLGRNLQNFPKAPALKESPQSENSSEEPSPGAADIPIEPTGEIDAIFERLNGGALEMGDSEIQASLGENNFDLGARESALSRSTRESTPCSFIRPGDSVSTPGSFTRPRSADSRAQNGPTAHEMEEFFVRAEQSHQRRFMEKYNFDIVNDVPLPGRYEWVKVLP